VHGGIRECGDSHGIFVRLDDQNVLDFIRGVLHGTGFETFFKLKISGVCFFLKVFKIEKEIQKQNNGLDSGVQKCPSVACLHF
jgi:hypothetical protein